MAMSRWDGHDPHIKKAQGRIDVGGASASSVTAGTFFLARCTLERVALTADLPGCLKVGMIGNFESATSQMVQRQQHSVGEPSEREYYSLYC